MKNFLLRFLLPPAYAVTIIATIGVFRDGNVEYLPAVVVMFLPFAYVFAGLPAGVFALIMGRLQHRGFRHGGVRLLTAMILGTGAGLVIGLILAGPGNLAVFVPLGFATGLLVELTVVLTENRNPTRP